MKYVINGKFLTQKLTGVQRFCMEMVLALDKEDKTNKFELLIPNDVRLPKEITELKTIKVVEYGKLKGILWEQIELPLYIKKNYSVGIHLGNVAPIIKPDIVCIHDMNVYRYAETFHLLYVIWCHILYFNVKYRCKKVLTVSNFSKSEIINFLKIKENKICVLREGWKQIERVEKDDNILKNNGLSRKKYYLSVYQMKSCKNFKWIVKVAERNPELTFVVTGWKNNKVHRTEIDIEIPMNLKTLGYVTDGELKSLMINCTAFIFPSTYEGFGLPPLEVLALNNNIIVGDIPVMREIFGDSVNYINPLEYTYDFSKVISINEEKNKKY